MSRYGSCETGRTEDSEGTERHLETPISLTGKRVKKEEPKTNNRLCHVFVLGSYRRRWRDLNYLTHMNPRIITENQYPVFPFISTSFPLPYEMLYNQRQTHKGYDKG